MQTKQDILREKVKITKAYEKEWTFKKMAEAINITDHSFYNWLNGYYNLSNKKAKDLQNLIADLLD